MFISQWGLENSLSKFPQPELIFYSDAESVLKLSQRVVY